MCTAYAIICSFLCIITLKKIVSIEKPEDWALAVGRCSEREIEFWILFSFCLSPAFMWEAIDVVNRAEDALLSLTFLLACYGQGMLSSAPSS